MAESGDIIKATSFNDVNTSLNELSTKVNLMEQQMSSGNMNIVNLKEFNKTWSAYSKNTIYTCPWDTYAEIYIPFYSYSGVNNFNNPPGSNTNADYFGYRSYSTNTEWIIPPERIFLMDQPAWILSQGDQLFYRYSNYLPVNYSIVIKEFSN